jgi:flagella basal body P-ring formation protein FlgA
VLPALAAAILLLVAPPVSAAMPALKPAIAVAEKVVTVGDMFANAGDLAGKPLFLAPAPGTTGDVAIGDIRLAADNAGLYAFDDRGATSVAVTRLSTTIGSDDLALLLNDELRARGLLPDGATAQPRFDGRLAPLTVAATPNPATLVNLRYVPETGLFAARFALAGIEAPLDVTGRIDLMVEAPQLAATLPAGTILKASDIVTARVPLRLVQNASVATLDQLVGKQLQRQSLAGMVLKVSDVSDPVLIDRNELVTVYLHAGALTLTVKGTALNAASLGQPVSVLNASSKKMVHGVARADGAVEVSLAPQNIAGL